MHPPCELMVRKFLPPMRAMVASKLSADGFSQGRIAGLLGVSQAAVSIYLSKSTPSPSLEGLGIASEAANQYALLIAEDLKRNPAYAAGTLYSIWKDLLGKGALCSVHRAEYPFLAECDLCMRTFGTQESEGSEAIAHVSSAVALIESSPVFVSVMPEVSVNVAYAREGATSPGDVVAVPGRIVRVRERAKSFMRPEFGASTHLANILLTVRTRATSVRAAINLRFDARMERTIRKLGIRALTIGGSHQGGQVDPVPGALRKRMQESDQNFDALIDLGGKGLEPSLYLFAADAVECAGLAIKIARVYSAVR